MGLGGRLQLTPFIFYDYAWLEVISPLPSQRATTCLQGTGAGFRGTFFRYSYYEVDLGIPLIATSQTPKYHEQVHFKVGAQF